MADEKKTSYRCIEPIQHSGKRYEPEGKIALTEDDAAPLLGLGHIAALKAEKAAAAQ